MFRNFRYVNLYFTSLRFYESLLLIIYSFYSLLGINSFSKPFNKDFYSQQFSNKFKNKFNSIEAVTVPSGRAGIYSLLSVMGIGKGDEVLITGYTCSAVPEPLLFLGIKPIYVDIDSRNFGMKTETARKLITPRTKAIIIQHTFGMTAEIKSLVELAKEFNLKVIEDCALALGSRSNDGFLGTFGDASIFSFELSKTISVGWGGLILINHDINLAVNVKDFVGKFKYLSRFESFRRLFQAGISSFLYRHNIYIFGGYFISTLFKIRFFRKSAIIFDRNNIPKDYLQLLPDIQWLVVEKIFNRLDYINSCQRKASKEYINILNELGCNISSKDANNNALIRFPILLKNNKAFLDILNSNRIEAGTWFNQPVSCRGGDQVLYDYDIGSCANSEYIAKHMVNLPTHDRLSTNDLNKICLLLKTYLKNNPKEIAFLKSIK